MFYTYLIKHKPSRLVYYGSRTAKNSKLDDILNTYFTSSKIVKNMINKDGIKNFEFEIRKTFSNKFDCMKWERTVLKRMKVSLNSKFLNIDENQNLDKVIHVLVDTIFIYNQEDDICLRWPIAKEIPPKFSKGIRPISKERCQKMSERNWWFNPETRKATHKNKKPSEIWISGRGPNYISNSKKLKEKKLFWISNGIISYQHSSLNEIPEGFYKGRIYRTKPSGKRKANYIWITNGTINKQIKQDSEIEIGYRRGRYKSW